MGYIFTSQDEVNRYTRLTPAQKKSWNDYRAKHPNTTFAAWAGVPAPAPVEPHFTADQQGQYDAVYSRIQGEISDANARYDSFVAQEPVVIAKEAKQYDTEQRGRGVAVGALGVWGGGLSGAQLSDVVADHEFRQTSWEATKEGERILRDRSVGRANADLKQLDEVWAPAAKLETALATPGSAGVAGASGLYGAGGGGGGAAAAAGGGAAAAAGGGAASRALAQADPAKTRGVAGPTKKGRSVILNAGETAYVPASSRASGTPGTKAIGMYPGSPKGYTISETPGGRTRITKRR